MSLSNNNSTDLPEANDFGDEAEFRRRRRDMVEHQLRPRGIKDPKVLEVMSRVPRHAFVPANLRDRAYSDTPLHIGAGQTISQPYMVALMTEMLGLTGSEKVLEIGTGSGYQTAILAELARFVYSIERIEALAEDARERLALLGYSNVDVRVSDGSSGLPSEAPFDAIMVTAGAPEVPVSLCRQLAEDGRLEVPVGSRTLQRLHLVCKKHGQLIVTESTGCVFVPLIGDEGWES
jgi:protein-L-isoaspartate(D-aspartate) O-methyltransferase